MSESYEEVIEGESILRFAPGDRHELVCRRLHEVVARSLQGVEVARLLPPRTVVQMSPGTLLRPDLTLVTVANNKVWLIAEIVDSDDHRTDTVTKKQLFEDLNLPRLWMVDPRYDNVEVYHGGRYGLALKHILAGREMLKETILPTLALKMTDLFSD